jgi:hypothetical protein
MPYLPIFDIVGNALLAYIAVIAVTYSPFYAYISGALAGILMEIMLAPFMIINLVIFPTLSVIGAYIFSDKNERRLERDRNMRKEVKNTSPFIRIPLCAGVMAFAREVISRIYVYLGGFSVTYQHILRAFVAIGYTILIALIIMIPVRHLLGVHFIKSAQAGSSRIERVKWVG